MKKFISLFLLIITVCMLTIGINAVSMESIIQPRWDDASTVDCDETVDTYYGLNVPSAILSLALPTLSSITNALISQNMSTDQAENILKIYSLRNSAESRYDMVLDIVGAS